MQSRLLDSELLSFRVKENIKWEKHHGENFFWFSMDKCEKKEEENALHWLEEGLKDLAPPLYEPP